jgi:hypothetical protein
MDLPVPNAPFVQIRLDGAGTAIGARGWHRIELPPAKVIERVSHLAAADDVGKHLPATLAMVRHIKRNGDVIDLGLQFKVAFLSVKFGTQMKLALDGETARISYLSGEPRDLALVMRLHPDGETASVLELDVGFDIDSLGWVTKYFLRHHPEIRTGIFSGVACTVLGAAADLAKR